MFQRLIYQDWQLVFPIVSLVAAAAFFGVMTWGALRMKRPQVEHLARLPLEDGGPTAFPSGSRPASDVGRAARSSSLTP
jgi:hypothetical protein